MSLVDLFGVFEAVSNVFIDRIAIEDRVGLGRLTLELVALLLKDDMRQMFVCIPDAAVDNRQLIITQLDFYLFTGTAGPELDWLVWAL